MKILENKQACVGCGACSLICPVHCLTMEEDAAGFLYPKVDMDRCIGCRKCESVCVACQDPEPSRFEKLPAYYAAFAKKQHMSQNSTSGGILTLLARQFVAEGSVSGAAFDEDWTLCHSVTRDPMVIEKFAGSKYLQSRTVEAFGEIQNLLKAGEKVLFIGTPCQVEALLRMTGHHPLLYTAEFICHGVPSPLAWKKFVDYQQKKYKQKLVSYNFRDKKYGWGNRLYEKERFSRGKMLFTRSDCNAFHVWFGHHLSLRTSCFHCKFRAEQRCADLTASDFWGIEDYYPDFPRKQGCSAIIVNTPKGEALFRSLQNSGRISCISVSRDSMWDTPRRRSALRNFPEPAERHQFMDDLARLSGAELCAAYPADTFFLLVRNKIVGKIQNIIKWIRK